MDTSKLDALGRMPCPGCGQPVSVVSHIDKAGSPDGVTTIDLDLMPMAEHIAACNGKPVAR